MKPNENFRFLKGFQNYLIGDQGTVYSLLKRKPLKTHKIKGYEQVQLVSAGKLKMMLVHRLVALAFIPLEEGKDYVDHIDGNRSNNSVTNLRWCTKLENNNNPITKERISKTLLGGKRTEEQRERMRQAQQKAKPMLGKHHSKETLDKFKHRINGMKGKFGKDNPNSKPVAMLDVDGNIIETFANSLVVFQQYGIPRVSVCRCCNGKQKTAGGYKWKYIDKEIVL